MKLEEKEEVIKGITAAISELQEDSTVPKNVREKVQEIIKTLSDDKIELSMRTDKALQILDEIGEDSNLQTYTRTQIWNIVSMLEKA